MSNFKPKDLLEIIQIKWNRPIGLVASYFLTLGFISALSAIIKLDKVFQSIIFLSAILLITLFWLFSRKIPRVKKGKIGFVVNFYCSNEHDQKNFREDFIEHLQRLIKNSTAGRAFQFIDLSKKLAKKIVDQDDAHWLRRKTKAHFILYGQLKRRMVKGEQTYVLSMDGQISHRPISTEFSQKIAIEFAELLPRKTLIKSDDDIFNFEFTSAWAAYVAKYIIAIAAAISFDLQYSELLLSEIQKSMNSIKTDFPILLKLQNLTMQRLAEINIMQARLNYDL